MSQTISAEGGSQNYPREVRRGSLKRAVPVGCSLRAAPHATGRGQRHPRHPRSIRCKGEIGACAMMGRTTTATRGSLKTAASCSQGWCVHDTDTAMEVAASNRAWADGDGLVKTVVSKARLLEGVAAMRPPPRTARRTLHHRDPRPTPQIPTSLGTQPRGVGA